MILCCAKFPVKRGVLAMSPYLKANRLQDIIGALQIMGSYQPYKLSLEDWKMVFENPPISAKSWSEVFTEHPEFFRKNDEGLFSLMWRKAMPHQNTSRASLSADQTMALMDTALQFHAKAQEDRRDRRWWIPIVAAIMAFAGAVLGAYLKG
jgi:hypothetical protein